MPGGQAWGRGGRAEEEEEISDAGEGSTRARPESAPGTSSSSCCPLLAVHCLYQTC